MKGTQKVAQLAASQTRAQPGSSCQDSRAPETSKKGRDKQKPILSIVDHKQFSIMKLTKWNGLSWTSYDGDSDDSRQAQDDSSSEGTSDTDPDSEASLEGSDNGSVTSGWSTGKETLKAKKKPCSGPTASMPQKPQDKRVVVKKTPPGMALLSMV